MRMFRNHSAGWVSDRWPPFCRKLLAGLALIASGTLFVEFIEPFPDTWSSSWKQVGASIPVLTQDWDTNGSMKSFISRSIESIPRKMIIFLYLYILIVFHPFLGQKSVYLSCFIYFSRHSLGLLDAAWSTGAGYKNLGCLGTKKTRHFPMVQKGRKYLGISINWNDHYLPSISLNLKD